MRSFQLRVNIYKAVLIAFTVLLTPNLYAQETPNVCGTDVYWDQLVKENPELRTKQEQLEKAIQNYTPPRGKQASKYTIPVVFHVIHTYGSENVTEADIQAQVESLNKDFNQENLSELQKVNPVFSNIVGDMDIEFKLARKDPSGKCTNGIVKVYSPLTENAHDNVKSLSRWNSSMYLNIWVVKTINSSGAGGTILGYAYFPFSGGPSVDGIVIRADQVKAKNKTLTHEVGHYLGLYHTFQGYGNECGRNCNSSGDYICDTPPTDRENFGCITPGSKNSCTSDNPDRPDMVENFMDYGDCLYMFTNGQQARVEAILSQSVRNTLYAQSNLIATGVDPSVTVGDCAPIADFYTNQYIVCEGNPVNFYDNSYNGTVANYNWSFSGGTPTASSSKNPSVTFTEPGTYNVTLNVGNSAGSTSVTKKAIITVLPAESDIKTPHTESFENFTGSGWDFPTIEGMKWQMTNKAAVTGQTSVYFNNAAAVSEKEYYFTLPAIDMTTTTDPTLYFNLAFAQKNTSSKDVMRFSFSTDCGQTFNYSSFKTGSALQTTNAPVSGTFIPTENDWREESFSLITYKNAKNLIIRVNLFNRGGNDMYMDDINIGGQIVSLTENTISAGINVYPNPSSGDLYISSPNEKLTSLDIFDMSGRLLHSAAGIHNNAQGSDYHINLSSLNISEQGMYYVRLTTDKASYMQKVVVSHP